MNLLSLEKLYTFYRGPYLALFGVPYAVLEIEPGLLHAKQVL